MCAYQLICFWFSTEIPKYSHLVKVAVQTGVWLTSLFFLGYMLKLNYQTYPLYRFQAHLESHTELPSLNVFRITPNMIEVALYIKNNTYKNERIHSATGRHDKIYANDASLYFVTQRMPASRWHHYEPGVQNSAKVQLEIISELENNRVSLIVRNSNWDDMQEPNKSAASSNVLMLDHYLENYFHEVISFGQAKVYSKH
jgi:hypothetical protein